MLGEGMSRADNPAYFKCDIRKNNILCADFEI